MEELDVLERFFELMELQEQEVCSFRFKNLEITLKPKVKIEPKEEVPPNKEVIHRRSKALDKINPSYGHPSLGLIENDD